MKPSIIERALQLAASGEYPTVTAVRLQLKAESYDTPESHLAGAGIRRQLRFAIRLSRVRMTSGTSAAA